MAFVVSLLLAAKYLYHVFLGQQHTRRWLVVLRSGAAILIVGMLALDGLNLVFGRFDSSLRPIASVALIILAAAISYWHLRFAALRLAARDLVRNPTMWLLLCSTAAASYWSLRRFEAAISSEVAPLVIEAFMNGELHELPDHVAITDRNRVIPVYRFATDSSPERIAALSKGLKSETGSSAIFRAPPDPQANCHGWVFTSGRFLVKGDNVQQILDDNGYGRVSEPEAGDVIVYRDTEGYINHTGIVRGILDDSTIIVESKWGVEGTYLHAPEAQPFSQIFDFYRSARHGHLVVVKMRNEIGSLGETDRGPDPSLKTFHGQRQTKQSVDRDPDGNQG